MPPGSRSLLRRAAPWLAGAASLAAVTFLLLETKRSAELAGRFEVEARQAAAQGRRLAEQVEQLIAERDRQRGEVGRLAQEVVQYREQQDAMVDAMRRLTEQAQLEAAASAAARAAQLAPMPEGVRLCLAGLHECLRAEGYAEQRFVTARSLDEAGLHGVELVEVSADGLSATVLHAELMTATLDRGKGRLELRFFEGHRTCAGERVELPEEGWPIVFAPIDGRLFETRLPFLVRGEGVYAQDERAAKDDALVDPLTRNSWLERFDRLCEGAGGEHRLRVQRFAGMKDGCFLDAQIVGTNEQHHVTLFASAARVAVEVDEGAGLVSLRLEDGALRTNGVDSKISAEGYRMLLPNVTPSKAIETMLGMVQKR